MSEQTKCVMCKCAVEENNIEYDEEGNVWCFPCAVVEDDTGEVY